MRYPTSTSTTAEYFSICLLTLVKTVPPARHKLQKETGIGN